MKLSEIMKALEDGKTIARKMSCLKIFYKIVYLEGSVYYMKWDDSRSSKKTFQDHIGFWNDETYEILEESCSTET